MANNHLRTRLVLILFSLYLVRGLVSSGMAEIPAPELDSLEKSMQSTRVAAVGGASVAHLDDVLSFPLNSAGIAHAETLSVALSFNREGASVGLGIAAGDRAALAGGFWRRDRVRMLGAGIGWRVEDSSHNLLLFGAGMRGFTESEDLEGITFDAGLLARPVGGHVAFGAAIQNLGPNVQWRGVSEALPTEWRVGASYLTDLALRSAVSIELGRRSDQELQLRLGLDVGVLKPLFLRLGYHQPIQQEARLSAGLGMLWRGWGIDYAWQQTQTEDEHHVQLQYRVGGADLPATWVWSERLSGEATVEPVTLPIEVASSPASSTQRTPPNRAVARSSLIEIAVIPERMTAQESVLVYLLSPPIPDALRWELQVRDAAQQIVRHYGAVGHPPRMLTWDGLHDTGRRVPSGKYRIQLVIQQRGGEAIGSNAASVDVESPEVATSSLLPADVEDSSLPQVSVVCVPMVFTPDQDGLDDTAEFSIDSDARDTLTDWKFLLSIHGSTGETLITFPLDAVPARITWDGRDARGRHLPMGSYVFWLDGHHPSGKHYASPPQIVTISQREQIVEQIVIATDVFFEPDQAEIPPDLYDALRVAARAIRTHPSAEVRIEGHADDSEDEATNMRLSAERAANVFTYLVEQQRIPAYRLSMAGYGRLRPVEEGTPESNRRVEIIITTNERNIGP